MKKISILGTGMVGMAIGSKFIECGYEVMMGSRTADNVSATEWSKINGLRASNGTYARSAEFGDIIFNCTKGDISLQALQMAGHENLQGKILVDLANPLDFSKGMPPSLFVCNTNSLGETIQKQFPDVKVVKTLNTLNCKLMVNPELLPDAGNIFICGNDEDAKAEIGIILQSFGWKKIIDLGGIIAARGTEQLLPIWIQLMNTLGTPMFNFKIVS